MAAKRDNFMSAALDEYYRRERESQQRDLEAFSQSMKLEQEARADARAISNAARKQLSAAVDCVQLLVSRIGAFEATLNDAEEVMLCFIGGPSGTSFFPTIIEPINPDKIVFQGADANGRPFVVIQHVSQLNFAMQVHAVPKGEPPRRIGFDIDRRD